MEQAGIHTVLKTRAVQATAEGVELQDGRMIRGATVVCTIGTTMPLLAHRCDTFEDAVRMFDQQTLEFLCVLDKDTRLEGLVRRDELFEAFAQGKSPETKARDFMSADAGAVTPGDTILTVGELMNKQDLFWLPVVESKQDRRLIGIIRSESVLRFTVEQSRTGSSVD